jgi:hypothetical protein
MQMLGLEMPSNSHQMKQQNNVNILLLLILDTMLLPVAILVSINFIFNTSMAIMTIGSTIMVAVEIGIIQPRLDTLQDGHPTYPKKVITKYRSNLEAITKVVM